MPFPVAERYNKVGVYVQPAHAGARGDRMKASLDEVGYSGIGTPNTIVAPIATPTP